MEDYLGEPVENPRPQIGGDLREDISLVERVLISLRLGLP